MGSSNFKTQPDDSRHHLLGISRIIMTEGFEIYYYGDYKAEGLAH